MPHRAVELLFAAITSSVELALLQPLPQEGGPQTEHPTGRCLEPCVHQNLLTRLVS